jgi:O-acetyl-ADP-ribose deacetylase (regulator of RNase III)
VEPATRNPPTRKPRPVAGIPSIAFPAISTGSFGYPVEEAARVAVGAVLAAAPTLAIVKIVRFVLFSNLKGKPATVSLSPCGCS